MTKMPKKKECQTITFGGCINALPCGSADMTFDEHAQCIRERCKAERTQLVSQAAQPKVVSFQDKPINALPQQQRHQESRWTGEWQKIELAVDSGAAETVIPHDLVVDHPIRDTDASRAGLCYASATGQPIPNLGEQKLPLVTGENTMRGMTFQAAPVSRPLGSVKRICSHNHRVVFDDEGSYIQHKVTGEINWMREENGNYILDLWVMPNSEADFARQP
jgi:hypothetical protein